jgi:cation transporter-like permease
MLRLDNTRLSLVQTLYLVAVVPNFIDAAGCAAYICSARVI